MSRERRSIWLLLLGLFTVVALVGLAGCSDDGTDEGTSDTSNQETQEESADAGDGDTSSNDDSEDTSLEELSDGAQDIAQAWFVGPGSDFTADEFDWAVESIVQDDEGGWWARVSATPRDMSMETEQIYVDRAPGMSLWMFFDSGTGVDPETDDRFPAEVRSALQP